MRTELNPTFQLQLPDGLTARPGKLSDYKSAFELINTFARYINGHNELTDPEFLHKDWQNPGFNPETDIYTIFDTCGKMVALAETWLTQKPPVHPWNSVCVHPDYLDSNLWQYLLNWAENRSRSVLDQVPANIRVTLRTDTDHRNTHAQKIYQLLGWKQFRSFYRMETDLNSPPQLPPTPEGIIVRPFHPETETEAVYRAFTDAFRDHFDFVEQPFDEGFAEFKHGLISEPGYNPKFWFIALDDNEIAGVCICRPTSEADPESGFVNELGVRRAWRHRGLGSLLLKHAFTAFYHAGQKRASLTVDASSLTGALRLYEQAGMHVVRQLDNFEKELRPGLELGTQELT